MIHKFIKHEGGIQKLDVVVFMAAVSKARITPTQMHIFNSIFSIFGLNFKKSIDFLLTYVDRELAPAFNSIDESVFSWPTDTDDWQPSQNISLTIQASYSIGIYGSEINNIAILDWNCQIQSVQAGEGRSMKNVVLQCIDRED